MNKLIYLGNFISLSMSDEVLSRISKTRLTFTIMMPWRNRWSSTKYRLYEVAVRSVLLHSYEAWPLRAEDIRWPPVFENRCFCTIGRILAAGRDSVGNSSVRLNLFGSINQYLEQSLKAYRWKWLGHVLFISTESLPHCALCPEAGNDWKMVWDGYRKKTASCRYN